jgi:transcriptional regulator with XRE-family HTH domain
MTVETMSDKVGANIRDARKARHLTPAALAEQCTAAGFPISRSVIENIEHGRRDKDGHRRRDITIDEVWAIAAAMKMSPVELVTGFGPNELTEAMVQVAGYQRAMADLVDVVGGMAQWRDRVDRLLDVAGLKTDLDRVIEATEDNPEIAAAVEQALKGDDGSR